MKYDASDPHWPDRDRFILSNGHASILLYSMLFLTGTGDLTLDDLKQFRQWGSKTPGHPEARHTIGVEVTTGPLGQGFGNGVGHGHRRALPAQPVRQRRLRPPHVRLRRRRLPRRGSQPRSGLARRSSAARPARLRVRRQPHHDRRSDGAELQRRRRQAVRGLRLARRPHRRGRQRHAKRSRLRSGAPSPTRTRRR